MLVHVMDGLLGACGRLRALGSVNNLGRPPCASGQGRSAGRTVWPSNDPAYGVAPQVFDTPAAVGVAVLNRMLAAGRPDSVRRQPVIA